MSSPASEAARDPRASGGVTNLTRLRWGRALEIACVGMLYAVPLTLTWTVAGVHIAIGIAAGFALAFGLLQRRWLLSRTPADAAFLAWIVAACAAAAFAQPSASSVVPLKKLALIPLVHLAAVALSSGARARTALRLFVFAAGVTALVSGAWFVWQERAWLLNAEQARLRTTTHYMTWSGLLLLALPLAAAATFGAARRWAIAYGACTAVLGLALLLTQTRSAWLGVIVAACALVARVRARLLWLVPVVLAVAFVMAPAEIRSRAVQSFDLKHHATADRFEAWKAGWAMWQSNPWTGVGLGDLQPLYREHAPTAKHVYGHLHNNWMHVLASMGLLGIVAFGWLMLSFGRIVWRSAAAGRGRTEMHALAIGAWGSFWGFQVMGLFEWNFGDVEVTIALYFLLGTLLAATRRGMQTLQS